MRLRKSVWVGLLLTIVAFMSTNAQVPPQMVIFEDGHWEQVRTAHINGSTVQYVRVGGTTASVSLSSVDWPATEAANSAIDGLAGTCAAGNPGKLHLDSLPAAARSPVEMLGRRLYSNCLNRVQSVPVSGPTPVVITNENLIKADDSETSSSGFRIVRTEDISYGSVVRLNVRVSLGEHYSQAIVEQFAKTIVRDITDTRDVNAISMLFYGPGASTASAYDVASVDWAPQGDWGKAHSVRTGDYTSFRYRVSYNSARPKPTTRGLTRSNSIGLLGVPLPSGARLIEKTPETANADPKEQYEIDAGSDLIIDFFLREMLRSGWKRTGPQVEHGAFFVKGKLMIGVLTKKGGRTFSLMGS